MGVLGSSEMWDHVIHLFSKVFVLLVKVKLYTFNNLHQILPRPEVYTVLLVYSNSCLIFVFLLHLKKLSCLVVNILNMETIYWGELYTFKTMMYNNGIILFPLLFAQCHCCCAWHSQVAVMSLIKDH